MTTTFHSTRSTTDSLTAKQAIRKGIADDGGLFVSDALGKTKVDVASLPGKSYQQIAAEVGYHSARYFISSFRNYCGLSPNAYREKYWNAKEEPACNPPQTPL